MKILVGMSGGVDSSAAALLLKERGEQVAGATLMLCPWAGEDSEEVQAARDVCEQLGIDHYAIDFRRQFEEHVISPFCEEYLRARTPNPCIECNRHIKFGKMLDWALEQGFDAIATGHYARVEMSETGAASLYESASGKDQSYVLWRLSGFQLARALFPLEGMEKQMIRELVKQAGLPVYSKKDSQDICFVPDGDYSRFIEERYHNNTMKLFAQPGNFVDVDGRIIGRHKGMLHYTIGQRKGLGGGFKEPMFVLAIHPQSGEIVLGRAEQRYCEKMLCGEVNIIELNRDTFPLECLVKIRYAAPKASAKIELLADGRARVVFNEPQRAITPGQSAVFYDGERVIGGGVIISEER